MLPFVPSDRENLAGENPPQEVWTGQAGQAFNYVSSPS